MKNPFSFEPPLLNPLFFRGFNLFLFANPHCFRFLIFSFLTFLIPLYRLRYNELILYF